MTDIGKVIKGFECCKDIHTAGPGYAQGCILCPYGETPSDGAGGYACFRTMVKDALAMLKAHEPRLMTLEEVVEHFSLPPVFVDDFGAQEDYYEDIQPLYFEFPHQEEDSWIVHWRGYAQVARHLDEWKHLYNKKWRCWTAKPTDEQRKEVKWE